MQHVRDRIEKFKVKKLRTEMKGWTETSIRVE